MREHYNSFADALKMVSEYTVKLNVYQYNAIMSVLVDHATQKDSTSEWIDVRSGVTVSMDELLDLFMKAPAGGNLKSYATGENKSGKWIQCLRCMLISYNPNDVLYRYCGHCHRFHDDEGTI